MKIGDVYGGKFLKANREGQLDIPGSPYEMTVTIRGIDVTEFKPDKPGDDPRRQIVLSFNEIKELELGLNVTNARSVALICGSDDTDDWIGKRIELFAVPEERSATGHAIRIRKPRAVYPPPQAPQQQAESADTMGALAAVRLHDKIKALNAQGKTATLDSLRASLSVTQPQHAAVVNSKDPANWPKAVGNDVAAWLEACAIAEDAGIPF